MTENSANAVKKVATPYMGPQQADSIIKYMTAELGLKDLYTGFDGEYIRVWLWSSDTTWVLDLWNSPNKNGGSITVSTITEKENDSRNWRSIVCECNDLKPKHGWKQMFDKISKMEISKLPDGDSLIKEIAYLTSPPLYQFEFVKKDSHKLINYSAPYDFQQSYKPAKKIVEFIDYIDSEFGLALR